MSFAVINFKPSSSEYILYNEANPYIKGLF